MARVKAVVLVSGRGSNLQALLDASADPEFPVEIARVISDLPDAFGLVRAANAGVSSQVIDHTHCADRSAFETSLDGALRACGAELVCLAGFMRLLSPAFIEAWSGRVINMHPSLLPSFKGLHTHRRALEAGVTLHGCSVHFVTPDLDDGPIILQAAVPVMVDDDEASLARRVLNAEHLLYPLAVRFIGEGRVSVDGRRVRIRDAAPAYGVMCNPTR